ncbi:MAG: DUF1236 domain-containing protein, partial [Gammaproteobacteria bacterium]
RHTCAMERLPKEQRCRSTASCRFTPGDANMKRTVLAGVAILALACPAFAQSAVVTTPGASATITLAPEQRTRIKRYVVEKRVKPVTIRERVSVGATLPADVELVDVPGDWGPELSRYRYVYAGDNVVLVEPSSRRVVQVID